MLVPTAPESSSRALALPKSPETRAKRKKIEIKGGGSDAGQSRLESAGTETSAA